MMQLTLTYLVNDVATTSLPFSSNETISSIKKLNFNT